MEDAYAYLKTVGLKDHYPKLEVHYGTHVVDGSATSFSKTKHAHIHGKAPTVSWDHSLGPCKVVMVDPDAPDREGDGPARFGPYLHWLVTDAIGGPTHGKTVVEYTGPAPPKVSLI